MKVADKPPLSVVNSVRDDGAVVHGEAEKIKSGAIQSGKPGDKVELSNNLELFNKVNEALKQLPEMRTDRVAEVKKQVESGQYQIKAVDVAERVVAYLKNGLTA